MSRSGGTGGMRPGRRGGILAVVAVIALLSVSLGGCIDAVGPGSRDLEILWPRNGATLYGYEVLRARVRGYDLEDYDIYWYVDNGVERRMYDEWYEHPPHKAYGIDTYDWYWNGRGPYTIGFIAEDFRGRRIARREVRVYID